MPPRPTGSPPVFSAPERLRPEGAQPAPDLRAAPRGGRGTGGAAQLAGLTSGTEANGERRAGLREVGGREGMGGGRDLTFKVGGLDLFLV